MFLETVPQIELLGVLALFPEDVSAFSISVVTFNDFSLE